MIALINANIQPACHRRLEHGRGEPPLLLEALTSYFDLWQHQEGFAIRALCQRVGELHQSRPNGPHPGNTAYDLDQRPIFCPGPRGFPFISVHRPFQHHLTCQLNIELATKY